jgi:hypothetical protein
LLNLDNAVKALAEMPGLTSFGFIANGSNKLDGIPLLEALKGNKNIKSIEIHENWLNNKPELVQLLAGLPSLETLVLLPGDTMFNVDISPLFVPSSPLRRMECNPVNFMNEKLAQLLPETELRSIRFYIQWDKKERVAAVRDFCSSAWSNYTLKIQQKYNDRCGLDLAKIAIIRATLHHGALKSLSEVFFMLQTLMLPADRGLFQTLLSELLVPILHPITYLAVDRYFVGIKDLMKLIKFARRRELMQIKDRRKIISEIWLALELNERP